MMRQPTQREDAYAWHSAAIAGKNPPITHEPECGYFARRFSRGGPLVPARIFWEQPTDPETGELIGDEVMRCEVAGKRRVPGEEWTYLAGNPITHEEFLRLSAPSFAPEPGKPSSRLPF